MPAQMQKRIWLRAWQTDTGCRAKAEVSPSSTDGGKDEKIAVVVNGTEPALTAWEKLQPLRR